MNSVLKDLYLKKSKIKIGNITEITEELGVSSEVGRILLTADRPIGVVDKYGKYIYEGDLVKVYDKDLVKREGGFLGEYIVKYDLESASYLLHNKEDDGDVWQFGIKNREYEIIEKIGE